MARRIKRFTIYDAMEERGDFSSNPANTYAQDKAGNQLYKGPVEFPRMVYAAEEEIIVSGTYENIKGRGDINVGELKALVNKAVNDKAELAEALESGWFDHPAKALKALIETNKAAGIDDKRRVPVITAQETLDEANRQIAELQEKLAQAQALAALSGPHVEAKRTSRPTTSAA